MLISIVGQLQVNPILEAQYFNLNLVNLLDFPQTVKDLRSWTLNGVNVGKLYGIKKCPSGI